MSYLEIINLVANKLNLPIELVKKTYEFYWLFIRENILSLPLKEDLTEEQFNELRTNFNVPSIGKLSITWDRYQAIKNRYKYIKELKNGRNSIN